MSTARRVTLSIQPEDALVDDRVDIRVDGLWPDQAITLNASLKEDNIRFDSIGHYRADHSGRVDVTSMPSLGGTYTGTEPMGLFWSMELSPGQKKGLRLLKKDVTVPYNVNFDILDGHISWEYLWDNRPRPIQSEQVLRWYKHRDVSRTEIEHGRVRGTLFVPPGKGPFPGVVDMFGTAGGLLEFRASLLASRGFTTFALPYFNYKDLPKTLDEIDLDYFVEVADWFCERPEVQSGGIGVGGVSKGGELSLLMAAYCPQISACVNINGPPHHTLHRMRYKDGHLPGVSPLFHKIIETEEGAIITEMFPYDREHVIPIAQSKAKFLMLLSEDDGGYDRKHVMHEVSLLPESKRVDIKINSYPGAGHLIEPPYAPHCRVAYYSLFGNLIVWGGQPKPHSDAQEHSWADIIKFYRENVGHSRQTSSKL